MEHEAITVRQKDLDRVQELIRSTRASVEEEYVAAVEDNAMEADVQTARRLLDEAHQLVTTTVGTDRLTITGSTDVLEDVALKMLREAVEGADEAAAWDPPQWQQLDEALEDVSWWRKAHEDLYAVAVAK